jgi:hypothetical protein
MLLKLQKEQSLALNKRFIELVKSHICCSGVAFLLKALSDKA